MSSAPAPRIEVTRTYLELRAPGALRGAATPATVPRLERRRPIGSAEYLGLYTLVGERWAWRDRLRWTEAALDAHLASDDVHVVVARDGDAVAGYVELQRRGDDVVEIMYFGLAPAYIGRGLGGWLLTRATEMAFELGAERIVLNTCTLDGPHALPNYLARGFTIVREEVVEGE